MISKNMYNVLKLIPQPTKTTCFHKLYDLNILNSIVLADILEEAKSRKYIGFLDFDRVDPIRKCNFYLTELGKTAIEEYDREKGSSTKATWALIISALSLIASIIAIIFGVQ